MTSAATVSCWARIRLGRRGENLSGALFHPATQGSKKCENQTRGVLCPPDEIAAPERAAVSGNAEDLIQDALLRLEQYRQKAEVRSEEDFLIRTVTNLAINEYHRHSRVLYEDEPVEELASRLALADPRAGPERQLAAQQELEEIKRVLDASSPRTRQIYFAHRSGYTYRDIAVVTGVSERTVEKHIARAVYLLMQAKESL